MSSAGSVDSVVYTDTLEVLEAGYANFPSATAITTPDEGALSYEQLYYAVRDLIDALRNTGANRTTRVATVLGNGPELATVLLGACACCVAVPLNPKYSEREFAEYFSDLAVDFLLTDTQATTAISVAQSRNIPVLELASNSPPRDSDNLPPDHRLEEIEHFRSSRQITANADDIVVILQTSGSTS